MKNRNLVNSLIISVILTLFVVLTFICYWFMPLIVYKPAKQSSLCVNKPESTITVTSNAIKILQLTDFHINAVLDMPTTYLLIKQLIYKTEPDLLVLTGDIFSSGSSKQDVTTFINFTEKFKLPWATVFGNHDDETPYSMQELSNKFENANYSLFKTGNLTNLYGNYFYNITFLNQKQFQLIFMDTRHDGFTEDSVNFYASAVNSVNTSGTNPVNNFLFFHIPISEVNQAISAYKLNPSIGTGKLGEPAYGQENQVNFYNKITELNKTKALIYGHDHFNNARISYNGIDFCYGTKTGVSASNDNSLNGGVLYTLSSNGTYSAKTIFA